MQLWYPRSLLEQYDPRSVAKRTPTMTSAHIITTTRCKLTSLQCCNGVTQHDLGSHQDGGSLWSIDRGGFGHREQGYRRKIGFAIREGVNPGLERDWQEKPCDFTWVGRGVTVPSSDLSACVWQNPWGAQYQWWFNALQ